MKLYTPLNVRVKYAWLATDQVKGLPAAHPRLVEFLKWLVALCQQYGKRLPVVTDGGRTNADMMRIYFEEMRELVSSQATVTDQARDAAAANLVFNKKSWHRLKDGKFSAVDIRWWTWGPRFRAMIFREAAKKWPDIEALDHGKLTNRHLHFGFPVKTEPPWKEPAV